MLSTLEVKNFRSYKDDLFEFANGVNIIVGPNASGKTNLLQAVHALATMKAFGVQSELLTFDKQAGRVHGVFDSEERVLKLQVVSNEMIIDGVSFKRISQAKKLPIVVFQPDHMMLLSKEPELRRQYLDDIISHTVSGYPKLLRDYRRALLQRNRILKNESSQQSDTFVWDVQLVDLASTIVSHRTRLVEALRRHLPDSYHSIAINQKDEIVVDYETQHISGENYADALHAELKKKWQLDKARGFTGVGPHRDDLVVSIRGKVARDTASRGELRSLILALKLYELEVVREEYEKQPILLLDDVFGELDGSRRKALARALQDTQTFLTSTDADVALEHFKDHNIIPL